MIESAYHEDELGRGERDGDRLAAAETDRPGVQRRALPSLPSGHEGQPARGAHDPTARLSFESHRVYGVPDQEVTCDGGEENTAVHWIRYARTRNLTGPRLTFERSSSLVEMKRWRSRLLQSDEIRPRSMPPVAPSARVGNISPEEPLHGA